MKDVRIPASKESKAGTETVEAAPNHGFVIEPKTVDAGADCGTGHWEGQGTERIFVSEDK
jgi:hypothetical protein